MDKDVYCRIASLMKKGMLTVLKNASRVNLHHSQQQPDTTTQHLLPAAITNQRLRQRQEEILQIFNQHAARAVTSDQ